jgi:hypothetical protein
MTWISELEEELRTLERLIAASKEGKSPSRRLSAASLEQRFREVRERLANATRPQLLVHLNGPSISDHEIKLETLGPLLDELQETISSIGQALRGSATEFSSIPLDIREQTALAFANSGPGSVILYLRAPYDPRSQGELPFPDFDEKSKPLAVAAMEKLISVVRLARNHSLESEALVEDIYPLGARTYKHLSDLVRIIRESETSADLTLLSPVEGEHHASLTVDSARRIQEVLKRTRVAEESSEIVGELRGVSSIRNAFELATPEGSVISGKVREDLVPSLRTWYERPVIATLEVTVTRSLTTGVERRRHLLVGLADAGQGME